MFLILFVVDVPIKEKSEENDIYTTMPLGMIVVRDDFFITVSLRKNKIIDLTGQRFGKLIAIRKYEKENKTSDRSCLWFCKCDCGNETIVKGSSLRNGYTKSCGCLKKRII